MKKFLLILSLILVTGVKLFAQEELDDSTGNEKMRDKMREFIAERLSLNNDEAKKFTPVFVKYFREWRGVIKQYRGDRILLQQKTAELQLRYRTEFREIMGEQRGGRVFDEQRRFIVEVRKIGREKFRGGNGPLRKNRVVFGQRR